MPCLRRRSCHCVWWLDCPPLQGTDQGGNLLRRLHAWDVLYHGLNVITDELLMRPTLSLFWNRVARRAWRRS